VTKLQLVSRGSTTQSDMHGPTNIAGLDFSSKPHFHTRLQQCRSTTNIIRLVSHLTKS